MSEMQERALDQLLEITVLLGADMARGLGELGLTQAQAHLLYSLAADGPSTQRVLADVLGVTPRAVTTYVDDLVAADLVARAAHPTDRRATLVTPTAAGEALLQQLVAGRSELAEQLFGGLGGAALDTLTAGLDEALDRLRVLAEEAR